MDYKLYSLNGQNLPTSLAVLSDPPQQLYCTGETFNNLLQRPKVAIVGSRQMTPYGRQVTLQLAEQLARHGIVVISGLALGVDAAAHFGALEAGTGLTIAVLPSSIDTIYPARNRQLALRIVREGGAIISEYDMDAPFMFKYNFVARNRLIAGLADAIVITEAAERSGSLHTAQFALDLGKPVLAVPGNITSPVSAGTNQLIKSGAMPVSGVEDVLEQLNLGVLLAARQLPSGSNSAEQAVIDLLVQGVYDGQALLERSQLPLQLFNQTLSMLEIRGHIRAGAANQWTLTV